MIERLRSLRGGVGVLVPALIAAAARDRPPVDREGRRPDQPVASAPVGGPPGAVPNAPPLNPGVPFEPPPALVPNWTVHLPAEPAALEWRRRGIEAQLDMRLTMAFPWPVPLESVLRYVRSNTQDEASGVLDGLPFSFESGAGALATTRPDLRALVTIDAEGVPIRRTLYLVLDQAGLTYYVADGFVVITPSPRTVRRR